MFNNKESQFYQIGILKKSFLADNYSVTFKLLPPVWQRVSSRQLVSEQNMLAHTHGFTYVCTNTLPSIFTSTTTTTGTLSWYCMKRTYEMHILFCVSSTFLCWKQAWRRGRGSRGTSSRPALVGLTHWAPDGQITPHADRHGVFWWLFIEDNGNCLIDHALFLVVFVVVVVFFLIFYWNVRQFNR